MRDQPKKPIASRRVRGTFASPEEYVQYQREQGLLDRVLDLMRKARDQGGEYSIFIQDPKRQGPDVQIIIRRVSEVSTRGLQGIVGP